MRIGTKRICFTLALFMLLAPPPDNLIGLFQGHALAQGRDETPAVLDEITVTAPAVPSRATTGTKTDSPIIDTSASIQVVPKETLEDQQAYSIDDALRNVSGLTRHRGTDQLQMRGMDVQSLRNGLPDTSSRLGFSHTLTDVERIEVLKGPASVLYGSGFTGGAINQITKKPLEHPLYSIEQVVGTFDTYRTTVDLGGPLVSGKLLYRFNVAYHTTDGFRDLDRENIEILPTFTWKLSNRHAITLNLDYRKDKKTPDGNGIPFQGDTILDVPLDTKFFADFQEKNRELFRWAINYDATLSEDLEVRANFSVQNMKSDRVAIVAGLVKDGESIMTGRRMRTQDTELTDYVFHLESVLKAETGSIKHTILGGTEYQLREFDSIRFENSKKDTGPDILDVFNPVVPEQNLAFFNLKQLYDREGTAKQFSLYLQDQIAFSEAWKTRVGARYERFDNEFEKDATLEKKGKPSLTQDDDEISWNAGLVYR